MKARSLFLLSLLVATNAIAQDRIASMPGYDTYRANPAKLRAAVKDGRVSVQWSADFKRAYYKTGDKGMQLELATGKATENAEPKDVYTAPAGSGPRGRGGFSRGRQVAVEPSPDGKWRAEYRNNNVVIVDAQGTNPAQVTTEGSASARIKYGSASWVYGEELNQNTAMWWSPDGKKLAYYRFDESKIPDYFLTTKIAAYNNVLYPEAYVKAGGPNPVVDLFVYDLDAKKSVKVDVRGGKEFTNDVVGHYVYSIRWSPDGKELFLNRTNRQQNILEFCAANPDTGTVRTIIREEWSKTWNENSPTCVFLADNKRFIWESERNGFNNFYLYDLTGKLLATLTNHTTFEATSIVKVDEKANVLFYNARSVLEQPHRMQVHRVGLDGKNGRRLTDPTYAHSVTVSPDSKWLVDVATNYATPSFTSVVSAETGKVSAKIGAGDASGLKALNGNPVEPFQFLSADGKTMLWGELHKPSNFDPTKKYPILVSTYNGPDTVPVSDRFELSNALTEYGFLLIEVESHGGGGRGKAFKDAMYKRMGIVEIDDMAAGVKEIGKRSYADGTRVGVFGTSYGGYTSIMSLLRYPDVFHAACAGSPVTAWNHYDSIYTERYMWIPQENADGYKAGSAMTYAKDKKGSLLITIGTADDNVHPANSYDLINALRAARKSYEFQVMPDGGHVGPDQDRMMEFFIERLILDRKG